MNIWEIDNEQRESVGSLEFGDFGLLRGQRTATGFLLRIPVRARFRLTKSGEPLPLLSNIRGDMCTGNNRNDSLEVGTVSARWFHSGAYGTGEFAQDYQLTWIGALEELAAYEKIRAGGPAKFRLTLYGELCYLVGTDLPRYRFRTHPQQLYGNVEVTYDKDTWIRILRELNVSQNVLVEVPVPRTPATDWDDVWNALIEARTYFEQGGKTGWKGCASAVRLALEKWQKLEREDQGLTNWKSPTPAEKEVRTKQQRLDSIRWHLLQFSHLGPHTHAETWSREDAIFLLSTLSCLLSERHGAAD